MAKAPQRRRTKTKFEETPVPPKPSGKSQARRAAARSRSSGEVSFDDPGSLIPNVAALVITTAAAKPVSSKDLRVVRQGIEKLLIRQAGPRVRGAATTSASLAGEGNIVGVGETLGDPLKGAAPGEQSLMIYTAEKTTEDKVKGHLSNSARRLTRASIEPGCESIGRALSRPRLIGSPSTQHHAASLSDTLS